MFITYIKRLKKVIFHTLKNVENVFFILYNKIFLLKYIFNTMYNK